MSARYIQLHLLPTDPRILCLYSFFIADGVYREGDIRLVGGAHNWEGRVEIYWRGSWGTISDPSWSTKASIVVCRQLQHSSGSGKGSG